MSVRLDQSLDSIIGNKKKQAVRSRRGPVRKTTAKVAAPVGGVKKATKAAKPGVKAVSGPLPNKQITSKIVVSGLPIDVNETQIKDYFQQSVGPVKRVALSYNQDGKSRGIADVIFTKGDMAAKAAKEQSGIRVDGRPMKIEVVMDAKNIPDQVPRKSLTERVAANAKARPKSATTTKADAKKQDTKKSQKKRTERRKPKTQEELDADMTDYWGTTSNTNDGAVSTIATTNGTVAAAANTGDDMGMEEIS